MKTRELDGYLLAIISALGFSTLGIFAIYGYRSGLSTFTMLTIRFAGTALFFIPWILVTRERFPSRKDAIMLAGMGGIGYTSMAALFFEANRIAPVGIVSAILYTFPAIVVLSLSLLGWERMTGMKAMALAGTFTGMVLIVLASSSFSLGTGIPLLGIVMGVGASLIYSAYIVVGTSVLRRVSAPMATFIVMGSAAVVCIAVGSATGSLSPIGIDDSWIIAGLVIPATALAVAGFFFAMQRIGSGRTSIISNVEPVGAVFLGWAVLGQRLSPLQYVGAAVIIVSAFLLSRKMTEAGKV